MVGRSACHSFARLSLDYWETRSRLTDGIARGLFTVAEDKMVLLHGFVKKSQKMPLKELATAKRRLGSLEIDQLSDEEEKDE
jgi:phage-related protein